MEKFKKRKGKTMTTKLPNTYPDKLYYACPELGFEIFELRKTKEESDDSCVYKYKKDSFDVDFYSIVEYAKEFAEEDGEEYNENEVDQDFSLTLEGAKKIAIAYLNNQVIELEKNITTIKNKIISLS
jgi:hypothetical protein